MLGYLKTPLPSDTTQPETADEPELTPEQQQARAVYLAEKARFASYRDDALRLIAVKGWTLDVWRTLPDAEKDTWLHWMAEREHFFTGFVDQLLHHRQGNLYTPEIALQIELTRLGYG